MNALFHRYFPEDWDAVEGYYQALRQRLKPVQKVLDLGCGANVGLAAYRTPQREVWGVDCERHPNLQNTGWFRMLAPDGGIPFPECTFDLVAASWVLEHVRQPEVFLSEVERVLRPGGQFIALTVNAGHYVAWLSRLIRCLPHAVTQQLVRRLYGRAPQDTFPAYYRLNTESRVRELATAEGLDLATVKRIANVDYFSFCRPLRQAAVLVDWTLERLLPGRGRLYVMFTLEKPRQAALPLPWVRAARLAA